VGVFHDGSALAIAAVITATGLASLAAQAYLTGTKD
jgi:hypothetical protein